MKKGTSLKLIAAIVAAFMITLSVVNAAGAALTAEAADAAGAAGDAGAKAEDIVLAFESEADYDGLFAGRFNDVTDFSYDAEKKCWVLYVEESTDPFIEIFFGSAAGMNGVPEISADKYKIIQFGVRYDPALGREGQFYFQTSEAPEYQESKNLSYLYGKTNSYQYVNVDASGNGSWRGNVADCRFDLLTTCRDGGEFELYYVGFFADVEAADAYGSSWLKKLGADQGDVPETGEKPETKEVDRKPHDLIIFDKRAGNINTSIGESLFDAEKVSQIDAAYYDKNSGSFKLELQAGSDPFIEMMFGTLTERKAIEPVPCSDYKVLQIAVKADVTKTSRTGTLYFQTDAFSGYGETKNAHYDYIESAGIQILNIDFSGQKLWEGNVANCRFDMFEDVMDAMTVDVYYVAFFADAEAADTFAAAYLAWDANGGEFPAEVATAAPTKEPTAAPEATPVPAGTDAPAVSVSAPAPAATSGGNGSGSGDAASGSKAGKPFPVVPVVAGAVAFAAVSSVVVILSRKKKK